MNNTQHINQKTIHVNVLLLYSLHHESLFDPGNQFFTPLDYDQRLDRHGKT